MALKLVDGRLHGALIHDALQVFFIEVGYADCARLAFLINALHCRPHLEVGVAHLRVRPVDEEQVDIIGLQIQKRLIHRVERRLITHVGDLGSDEQVLAVHAAFLEADADFLFVSVYGGGVDVPVSGLHGPLDGVDDFLPFGFPNAQTEPGHQNAVVQPGHIID